VENKGRGRKWNLLLLLLDYGPSLFGCRPRRGIVALCHPLPVLRKPQ